MFGLMNKIVIITGGGAGVGRATALAFAEIGARVVVADVNRDTAQEVIGQIRSEGKRQFLSKQIFPFPVKPKGLFHRRSRSLGESISFSITRESSHARVTQTRKIIPKNYGTGSWPSTSKALS